MAKTRIVTTQKNGGHGKHKGKKAFRHMTKKVHRTHKGYSMKRVVKSHNISKRGKKR